MDIGTVNDSTKLIILYYNDDERIYVCLRQWKGYYYNDIILESGIIKTGEWPCYREVKDKYLLSVSPQEAIRKAVEHFDILKKLS